MPREEVTGRFRGLSVIVTGAGRGLGRAFSSAFLAEGAMVTVSDLAAPDASVFSAPDRVEALACDVTDRMVVEAMVAAAAARFGRVDIVINNAAIAGDLDLREMETITSSEWDRILAVNARGTFEISRAALPYLKESPAGAIVNLGSGVAYKGSPGFLHYVASKGAVLAMTRAMARELGTWNIRVNAVSPGLTMTDAFLENESWAETVISGNVATRALKRNAHADDIVGAVLFLASHEARFVTGQSLVVDGGSVMA